MAYKLMPNPAPTLLAKPYSLIAKRGLFATKHLWVTPHKEEERYPSGDWVLQGEGGEGLEQWVKQVPLNDLALQGMPYIAMGLCLTQLSGHALHWHWGMS